MSSAAKRMVTIMEVFQAAKSFVAQENNLEKIAVFCNGLNPEFISIAYEAASMSIALRDYEKANSLMEWQIFEEKFSKLHRTQIHVGLGWALAQQNISSEVISESFSTLLKCWIADGRGYYDGLFRSRQTIKRKEFPGFISVKELAPYHQGIGRSLWYISKGDAKKVYELLTGFALERQSDLWRGIGIAVAYVGGSDDATLKSLSAFSGIFRRQLSCGILLALRSRFYANCFSPYTANCCKIICNMSSIDAINIAISAEQEDYSEWLRTIEKNL